MRRIDERGSVFITVLFGMVLEGQQLLSAKTSEVLSRKLFSKNKISYFDV